MQSTVHSVFAKHNYTKQAFTLQFTHEPAEKEFYKDYREQYWFYPDKRDIYFGLRYQF